MSFLLKKSLFIALIFLCCAVVLDVSAAKGPDNPEKITMQLRWLHQFQFAGYYAALHKGFYKDQGLDVEIVAGSPDKQPVSEVLSGRAQYGEANTELLHSYLKGEPVVALASIVQHSPSVLLVRKDSGIRTPQDLIDKRIMMVGGTADVDFLAMFAREGVKTDALNIIPSSYNIQDLIDGKTDAFNAYQTNEPFYLQEKNIAGFTINPVDYGIDFYSDILFTTRNEIENHPERVKAFVDASLQGWKYALENKQEIINLILEKYGPVKSREHLQYEADSMEKLILPDLIPIGNINPGRFEKMAHILSQFGYADGNISIDDFIHDFEPTVTESTYKRTIYTFVAVLLLISISVLLLWRMNLRLSAEIKRRTEVEQELRLISIHDPLTGIFNRLEFDRRIEIEIHRAERYERDLSLMILDLDHFKNINDEHGHQVGDEVLKAFCQRVIDTIRTDDIFFRYGGEEFVLILPETGIDKASELADRLTENVANTTIMVEDNKKISLTVSIGLASLPEHAQSVHDLLKKADNAVYQAKNTGRNQTVIANSA